MDDPIIGIVGFIVTIGLIVLRVPVSIALGVTGMSGLYILLGWPGTVGLIQTSVYGFAASWSLSAIPLFLLMGALLEESNLIAKIFRTARLWLSGLPGGLAMAVNVSSAAFATVSGSSMATAAAMGRMAIPEMISAGYSKRLAAGCVASAGTLGSLIPPSVLMILYGLLAEVSISKMLMAGLLPGLLTMIVYMLAILIVAKVSPGSAPRLDTKPSLNERIVSLQGIWPLPILFGVLLGGMYLGFVTPTEAAALGALMAMVYGFVMRGLTVKGFGTALINTLNSTAQIFMIAIGAVIFTRFLAISGLNPFLVEAIQDASFHPVFLFLAVSLMFVVLGMFLDPIGVMLLSIPVIIPIFDELGYNLIYIGVLVVKFVEIGLLTPPIGLNAFVVKSVVGDTISLSDIFKGIGIFLVCEVIIMVLLIGFPEISLFIPERL
tara:strand:+ start:3348 stop:4652 length:1305 start_codon:yes stop_codon:yes gene_type:complete